MKQGNLKYRSTWMLSRMVLYILLAVSALVFCAFYFIGYDSPFEDNPNFNAPVLTGVLILFLALLVVLALGVGLWAMVRGMRERDKDGSIVNGIHVARNSYIVAAFACVVMVVSFALGSSSEMLINGKVFASALWLKVADMFVASSLVMIVTALCVIAFGHIWSYMQRGDGGKV